MGRDIFKELAKSKIRRETIKSWKNREISCFLSRLNSLEEFYWILQPTKSVDITVIALPANGKLRAWNYFLNIVMLDPRDRMPSVCYDGFLLETSDTNIQYKSPQKILRETKFSNLNLGLSKTSSCRENHVAKYSK